VRVRNLTRRILITVKRGKRKNIRMRITISSSKIIMNIITIISTTKSSNYQKFGSRIKNTIEAIRMVILVRRF